MSNKEKKDAGQQKQTAGQQKTEKATQKKASVTRYFEQRIGEWLEKEMKNDPLFEKTVTSKPEKTIKGACNYVLKVAKDSGQAGWDDDEVYNLVRHYFDEDDVKDPGEQRPSKVIVSGHVDLTAEEKAEAMAKAEAAFKKELKEKAEADEKARREAEKKKAEERRKALLEKRERENAMQGDLFGF